MLPVLPPPPPSCPSPSAAAAVHTSPVSTPVQLLEEPRVTVLDPASPDGTATQQINNPLASYTVPRVRQWMQARSWVPDLLAAA